MTVSADPLASIVDKADPRVFSQIIIPFIRSKL